MEPICIAVPGVPPVKAEPPSPLGDLFPLFRPRFGAALPSVCHRERSCNLTLCNHFHSDYPLICNLISCRIPCLSDTLLTSSFRLLQGSACFGGVVGFRTAAFGTYP